MKWLSKLVDKASDYFALVIVNFVLPFFMASNFITVSNLFLHLGIIVAIIGFMLAWAL
jgi:hypothetical protein